jgi:polar amino acid transport system substrate-binding protein
MDVAGKLYAALCLIMIALPVSAENTPQDKTYQRIIQRGEIRIGISEHYPPLNFNAGRSGVEIEMAKELGKFLGVRTTTVPLSLTDYIAAIETGNVDIVMAGLSRNLERAKKIWFSEPYISMTPGVLANRHRLPQTRFGDKFEQNPIRTIWDLKNISGFKFAVKKRSSYEHLLDREFPGIQKIIVATNDDGLNALKSGKAHGFVHDSLFLEYLYRNSPEFRGSYILLQGGSKHEKICAGLPFGATVLKNQIDTFILELIRQGLIDEWLEHYNTK